jgi:hypothetical protein
MLALRWLIGILSGGAIAVFALIVVVGKGLASAYRSADTGESVAQQLAIVLVPVILIGMYVSVFTPGTRWLMHAVALGVIALALFCAMALHERPGEIGLYLGFLCLWLVYYALATFRTRAF